MKKLMMSVVGAGLLVSTAAVAERDDWPRDLTVGTASQGGVYFVYGGGMASFLTDELDVNVSGEVTGGPVQNVTLVQTGEHDIGLVTMGPAFEAWTGQSELAPGLEHSDIRALFPMYETPFHGITLRSSGITSVGDLDGRRVSVGPAGGTPARIGRAFSKSSVWTPPSLMRARPTRPASCRMVWSMPSSSPPASRLRPFSQLAAEADVITFGFTPEEHEQVLEAFPEVSAFTIPAGTYSVQEEDQASVAMWNYAIAHQDMPESLAYEITKTVLENNERMMQIHAAAAATLAENWDNNSFLPFHPGAVRYYEEIGIEIPEDLRG